MATGTAVGDVKRGTDETFYLCTVCKGKNIFTEADKVCVDCNDYYCSICVKCHENIPILKKHAILDKTQFQLGAKTKFTAVRTKRCAEHEHKPMDMYCEQHDAIGCSSCMVAKHSLCKNKYYVPEYVETNAKVFDSQDVIIKLQTVAASLSVILSDLTKEKEHLKSSKEQTLKQISQLRTEINQQLDELEMNTVVELNKIQPLVHKIESKLKDLKVLIIDVESALNNLKSDGCDMSHMFVSIKMANAVFSTAVEKVNSNVFHYSPTNISFVANRKILEVFNEMQALGSICLTEKLQSQPQALDQSTNHPQPQALDHSTNHPFAENLSRLHLLQVKSKTSYTVKVKSDRCPCDIISACTLEDGTVILADAFYSKLKRLDKFSYNVLDFCDVPYRPWQVCAIGKQEVAVSCYNSKLIQSVTIGKTMVKTRTIGTDFICKGLAYSRGKLFVSDNTSVYIYTMTGERLHKFNKYETEQGIFSSSTRTFSDIIRLAVSRDNRKIYVADFNKGLIILNNRFQLVGQFNRHKLEGAVDICLYKTDNVLVYGRCSQNILQFSPNGRLVGEVLKTVKKCGTVSCNKDNTKLIVAPSYSDEIEVYDINEVRSMIV